MLGELFEPKADLAIEARLRPHWSQAGAIVYITFRTIDSIPKEVLRRWEREKNEWMRIRGHVGPWSDVLPKLSPADQLLFRQTFSNSRDLCLDECHGRCILRQTPLSKIVADSLLHFDGVRYRMGDFVVIENQSV